MKKAFLFFSLCIVLCVSAFANSGNAGTYFYSNNFTVNLLYDQGEGNITTGSVTFVGPAGCSFYCTDTGIQFRVYCITSDPSGGTVTWSGTDDLGHPMCRIGRRL